MKLDRKISRRSLKKKSSIKAKYVRRTRKNVRQTGGGYKYCYLRFGEYLHGSYDCPSDKTII